jgi:hypothetical protein
MDFKLLYGKGPHPFLSAGAWVARAKITATGVSNRLEYCAVVQYDVVSNSD